MKNESPYSSHRWFVLLASSLTIMSLYINMIVFAPILGSISSNLNVPLEQATNLMMGFVLSVALVLSFGGVVCDKYGMTFALTLGLLCTSIPAVLMPVIGVNYGAVFIGRLVQGASVGFVFATIGPILALWFPPKEQGMASGVLFGAISIGSAIGVIASPYLFERFGDWRIMVAIMSIPGWISILMVMLFTRKAPSVEILQMLRESTPSGEETLTFGKAVRLPRTWHLTAIVVCNSWGLYCLYNLVPAYLGAPAPMGVGLTAVTAGNLSLALISVGIFAPFVGGLFFDRVVKGDPKPAVIAGFLMTGVFTFMVLLPSVFKQPVMLTVCLMLAGVGIPFMNASLSSTIAVSYPPAIIGRMMGFCFGIGTLGGALGLLIGGITIGKTGSFFTALAFISAAALVGILLIACFNRKQPCVSQSLPDGASST
ncbi:MAG: MFS transporter [Desulfuromonadales bacterium]|nr:MFS transporter [Desulfuromonadales bacterium]